MRPWTKFEDDVFKHVNDWLHSGRLSVNSSRARAYRKRKYYSEPRKADIEFEIAIEAFDDGATEPSVIWLWECKDHRQSKRMVEASEIESLNDKIDRLGRSRCKGSLVTTHGFQEGAIERARACGINLFVLGKELQRVSKYQQDTSAVDHQERMVVAFGLSFKGFGGYRAGQYWPAPGRWPGKRS